MKQYIFDASSILLLAKRHPDKAAVRLSGNTLLDLTIYEIGNAIWKINRLVKKSDKSIALDSMKQAYHLTVLMNVVKIQSLPELSLAMEYAYRYNLTFYDSAYLAVADKHRVVLVTEDKQLTKAAQQANIPTVDIESLIETT